MKFQNPLKLLILSIFFLYPAVNCLAADRVERTIEDSAITAEIKSKFIAEKLFGEHVAAPDLTVHVKTINGKVFLTGKTQTRQQLDRAIEIARAATGIIGVNSKVKVVGRNK